MTKRKQGSLKHDKSHQPKWRHGKWNRLLKTIRKKLQNTKDRRRIVQD